MNTIEVSQKTLVVPHFRGKAILERSDFDVLNNSSTPPHRVLETVRRQPLEIRQNIHRLLPAALLAGRNSALLAFVEGWKGHEIRNDRKIEFVRGTVIARMLLEMLQTRGLVSGTLSTLERPSSRCTEEEAEAIGEILLEQKLDGVLSITHCPNPSVLRARATLERVINPPLNVQVATPDEAMESACANGGLTEDQILLFDASALRMGERVRGIAEEAVNCLLDAGSEALHQLRGEKGEKPLVRLAHRRRLDQWNHADATRSSLPKER